MSTNNTIKDEENLFLILKAKWYWMIHDLIKREEYRVLSKYWTQTRGLMTRNYTTVTFQLGYSKRDRMKFEIEKIKIGIATNQAWGADPFPVHIIKLGNKIK